MTQGESSGPRFAGPGAGGVEPEDRFYREEVALALRNRGMPLEAMRDPITPAGLHYLLVHFDIPEVDAAAWRLEIGGLVDNPLSLSLEELKGRPTASVPVTLECAGNGRALLSPRPLSQPWLYEAIGTAEWTGTPLAPLLAEAGLRDDAAELVFTGRDEGVQGEERQWYQRSMTIAQATADEVLLAWEMNGDPIPPQHGYPVRLVVPGWYGMASVKWLHRIEAIGGHFDGYQMERTYRYSHGPDDPGDPVTTIRVRSLMAPPGIPDFMTRRRLLDAGPQVIYGRAWAGPATVERVEFSSDGGDTWLDAQLADPVGQWAWREWRCGWRAAPGQWTLLVRATDSLGNVQPIAQPWTQQGMGNNMAQRVEVVVE